MLWFSTVTAPLVEATLTGMAGPWLRLTLDIDLAAEPVEGRLAERPGPGQAFTGWTQLGQLVSAAIESGRARAAEAHQREGRGWA